MDSSVEEVGEKVEKQAALLSELYEYKGKCT